jgi:hypothetical protein
MTLLSVCLCAPPPRLPGTGIVYLEETAVARQVPGKHVPRSNKYAVIYMRKKTNRKIQTRVDA